jgi:hypothetical protein
MVLSDLSWTDLLSPLLESADARAYAIERDARRLQRAASTAVALEAQAQSEDQRARDLSDEGNERLAAMVRARASSMRRERAGYVLNAALLSRNIVNLALGRLTIDDTTAGTGLDESERVIVSQVSGRGV